MMHHNTATTLTSAGGITTQPPHSLLVVCMMHHNTATTLTSGSVHDASQHSHHTHFCRPTNAKKHPMPAAVAIIWLHNERGTGGEQGWLVCIGRQGGVCGAHRSATGMVNRKFKFKYLWGISSIMSPRTPETEMSTKIQPSMNAAASADW